MKYLPLFLTSFYLLDALLFYFEYGNGLLEPWVALIYVCYGSDFRATLIEDSMDTVYCS